MSEKSDQEWERFTRDLALCLSDLEEDEFLILTSKRRNYYVQFAARGNFGVRVEATSNVYVSPPEAVLSTKDYRAMAELGWHFPTKPPHSGPDPDGSPNFFIGLSSPVDFTSAADLAVRTFRSVYRISHPGELQYKAFAKSGTTIRFPTLRLKRET